MPLNGTGRNGAIQKRSKLDFHAKPDRQRRNRSIVTSDLTKHSLERSRQFTATGNMTTPRAYHTATLLQDGQVLIASGQHADRSEARLASAEVYDPSTYARALPVR